MGPPKSRFGQKLHKTSFSPSHGLELFKLKSKHHVLQFEFKGFSLLKMRILTFYRKGPFKVPVAEKAIQRAKFQKNVN